MEIFRKRLLVRHGIVYLRDAEKYELPHIDTYDGIWRTPSCIAATSLHRDEGEAHFIVGFGLTVPKDASVFYEDVLQTPSRAVVLETVYEELVKISVPHQVTPVRIWGDGHKQSYYRFIDLR